MRLQGKVALITGAERGIGRAIALGYAEEGCDVAVMDVDVREGGVKSELESLGVRRQVLQGDVSKEGDVRRVVASVIEELGGIDVLVNNAGLMMRSFGYPEVGCPFWEVETAVWDRIMEVNLKGAFLCNKFVVPHMIRRRRGSIINISSGAGRQGRSGRAPYVASKFGLEGLTQTMAQELKPYNIAVNSLDPGAIVLTSLVKVEALKEEQRKRILRPQVAVLPAIFLATQDASGITGMSINALEWNIEHGYGGMESWRVHLLLEPQSANVS